MARVSITLSTGQVVEGEQSVAKVKAIEEHKHLDCIGGMVLNERDLIGTLKQIKEWRSKATKVQKELYEDSLDSYIVNVLEIEDGLNYLVRV